MSGTGILTLGLFADPIEQQLHANGLTMDPAELARCQIIADAISTLSGHGFMGQSAQLAARKKLFKRIDAATIATGGNA